MSFSNKVKNEVLSQEMNVEQANALIHGIISSAGYSDEKMTLKLNNTEISNLIRDLLTQLEIKSSSDKENKN